MIKILIGVDAKFLQVQVDIVIGILHGVQKRHVKVVHAILIGGV